VIGENNEDKGASRLVQMLTSQMGTGSIVYAFVGVFDVKRMAPISRSFYHVSLSPFIYPRIFRMALSMYEFKHAGNDLYASNPDGSARPSPKRAMFQAALRASDYVIVRCQLGGDRSFPTGMRDVWTVERRVLSDG